MVESKEAESRHWRLFFRVAGGGIRSSTGVSINDIDEGLRSSILKFADDTKLFGSAMNKGEHIIVQEDLNALMEWSRICQMPFNTEKCKVLHVGHSNSKYQYKMGEHVLETSKEERDLGIIITDDLKSARHCQAAYNKANRVLGMIKRTIVYKSESILLPLYKSLVRPLVEYCIPVWSPCYQKDKVLLEKIQHRFTKMIPGLGMMDYSSRLDHLKLWTLEERRNRADLLELFKIFKNMSPVKVDSMFEVAGDQRTRGHSLKLKKHRSKLDLRKYFFSERVVNRWNALDESAVSAVTINSFKTHLQRIKQIKKGFFMDT